MFDREFLVVAFCLLSCWSMMAVLLKDFPSFIPQFWQGLLSIPDCINVTVPWVVTTCGVAMDISFHPNYHFPAPLTLRHQFP